VVVGGRSNSRRTKEKDEDKGKEETKNSKKKEDNVNKKEGNNGNQKDDNGEEDEGKDEEEVDDGGKEEGEVLLWEVEEPESFRCKHGSFRPQGQTKTMNAVNVKTIKTKAKSNQEVN
jgi:hypothetical protein